MKIELKILNKEFYKKGFKSTGGEDLIEYHTHLPSYATKGSAAIDLVCTEDLTIYPGETKMIPTGLAIWIGSNKITCGAIDACIAGLILPRSGLGTKGLILANTIGVIDADYQGELMVSAWNRNISKIWGGKKGVNEDTYIKPLELKTGNRFAQLMFVPVVKAQWEVVAEFSNKTDRGNGGFGSTGEWRMI